MKSIFFTLAILGLAGCTSTDMALWSGNFNGALTNLQGQGSVFQKPDGGQSFRFVIAEDAFDSLVKNSTEADIENVRLQMLGQFLGKNEHCQNGYQVTDKSITMGNLIYTGDCL